MQQRVFIVRGQRKIVEATAEIQVCAKYTWAELPGGRRHLLGSTAFFTRVAAERVKLSFLRKIVATKVLKFLKPSVFDRAQRQLDLFNQTGVLH